MRSALTLVVTALAGVLAYGQAPALKSGLNPSNFDSTTRPQDDFYQYVNGGWAARAAMPAERVTHGTFTELADKADLDLRALIEDVARMPVRRAGSPEQQIADLYRSILDEARLEALGAKPIEPELARLDAMSTSSDLAQRSGYLSAIGSGGPFGAHASGDANNPGRVIVSFPQGGILLPDRDYYLSADPKYVDVRAKYHDYLKLLFTLTARPNPEGDALAVVALETELARAHLPQADAAAPQRTAQRFSLRALMRDMPGFDWIAWARAQGIDGAADVILAQPSFFRAFAALVPVTPMSTWSAWLASRHITAAAPFLSPAFDNARFEFFGRVLSGQQVPIPRWKRGVSLVNGYLGDAIGKLYVERHFPPAAKQRVEALVANMVEASRQALSEASWMSPSARNAALAKVRGLAAKVGYPARWRDYYGLEIKADDLFGNVARAQRFENDFRMSLLRRPPGRDDWLVPPQTLNAFYRPGLNEIVVPAAMLQAPMYQHDADAAVNYGGIGAIIGHEIGHAFDEHASPRVGAALAGYYGAFRSIDGMKVDGVLTLGENVGDLGGLALAYRAYRLSLKGQPAPVIDGFTGDQRFFIGWAQVWRAITRDEYLRQWLTWMPHAPPHFRANGPLSHIDAFYAAFDVKPGDKLYVEPGKRIRIW